MPNYPLFATTPKAMEDILADELRSLGAEKVKSTIAGAFFEGDLATAYRVCLWSRIANRVLLQLSTFRVTSQDDLYQGVQKINWFEHLGPEGSFAVTFNAKKSQAINNTHFGALKVKDAVVDQMRAKFHLRPNIDTEQPDIRINVNLNGETAVLSLDLSGESLHRRGYRDTTIKAPIKENLAAALLIRSRWSDIAKQGGTLIDPMCGSGTLLVEGAMIAADYAPGLLRDYYGFIGWKKHDATSWKSLLSEALQRKTTGLKQLPMIVGFDKDRRNINAAHTHIATAGLEGKIHLECREIADAAPALSWKTGLLICNPPYGERLGDEQETAELYKKFGDTLKAHFNHWQAAMITSNPELGFRLGIRSQKPVSFYNGALECKLLRMTVEDTAFFVPKAKSADERMAQINDAIIANQGEIATDTKVSGVLEPKPENAAYYKAITEARKLEAANLDDKVDDKVSDLGVASFVNRLQKNLKKLASWKNKNNLSCYRIYDADLPEYAVAIDLYHVNKNGGKETWVNVQEYDPPKSIDPFKANQRLAELLAEIPQILGVLPNHVFLKIRRKQKSTDQYQKLADKRNFHVIEEHGCQLQVNFEDYLDTGLFLDHRPIRLMIQQQAKGKRFLNLFAYTGSATVHAAVGGAKATTTVDMSNTYLDWAKANLALNNTSGKHEFIQADCLEWLETEARHAYPRRYDLIFLDPPTFSNSKRMADVFDIQKDHASLIQQAATLLESQGVLYFSTNFRRFVLDRGALTGLTIEDITAKTIPEDFIRNPRIHYCWRIQHEPHR
ncbi:ribosomal RNA large subunit methyltransferase K/L [Methyloglobulus morosus KoM1]|uniref:Ribosomal RNA large subunit methyltransferase K/L n=1 Tax=Methyloglobulus morosus KoM1 TaxID=1116472 RepID=V5C5B0_9GAMM|nr:bifunctional 23S rRNA (guanine(2069)-N(7))-methyltransferase RlmK/23S rRNA (guanine(2445)-N(2))-methyltransferase RlmL [Methyloglobulus morosus]ESS71913.1 ribosomal RNA large subunit methyltransferase K/L [Methyloglobulus morosus KoM1]